MSNHFGHISGGYIKKTTQKQPKMVLSAGKKTFERWKLEKYKSDVSYIYQKMWALRRNRYAGGDEHIQKTIKKWYEINKI